MTREEAIEWLNDRKAKYLELIRRYPSSSQLMLTTQIIDIAIESLQIELVRCKYCKWRALYYNDNESFYCDKTGIINMHIDDGDDEFWCKYGERK